MRRLSAAVVLLVVAAAGSGCRGRKEAEREEARQATAEAEEKAREATLTGAKLEAQEDARAADETARRANTEIVSAFRLEQADFRKRLLNAIVTLESMEKQSDAQAPSGDVRAHRDLLKSDLDALDRSIEPDWATLRTKIERDLHELRDLERPRPQMR